MGQPGARRKRARKRGDPPPEGPGDTRADGEERDDRVFEQVALCLRHIAAGDRDHLGSYSLDRESFEILRETDMGEGLIEYEFKAEGQYVGEFELEDDMVHPLRGTIVLDRDFSITFEEDGRVRISPWKPVRSGLLSAISGGRARRARGAGSSIPQEEIDRLLADESTIDDWPGMATTTSAEVGTMDFQDEFMSQFLRLPEAFNPLAEEQGGVDTDTVYQACIRSPFGDGYSDADKLAGFHFELTVICEPIVSDSAEVTNDTVSFIIADGRIRNAVFERGVERTERDDVSLDEEGCRDLLAAVKRFCEASLPDESDLDLDGLGQGT